MLNQYAIYRVDLNTDGILMQGHSYQYVTEHKLKVSVSNYRQVHLGQMQAKETAKELLKRIHAAVDNPVLDAVGVSDVLVTNRNGEINCFYIDKNKLVSIYDFFPRQNSGNVIDMDTEGYTVKGKDGKWDTVDSILLDGNIYYLMEHQEFRSAANAVVLDSYGNLMADQVPNRFDEATKEKIRISWHAMQELREQVARQAQKQQEVPNKSSFISEQTKKLLLYQKSFINGSWERQRESGTEANYDMVDGRVNNEVKDNNTIVKSNGTEGRENSPANQSMRTEKASEGKQKKLAPPMREKPKKRTSVLAKLHQKQVDIAVRSGKTIPLYLQQQAERNRK